MANKIQTENTQNSDDHINNEETTTVLLLPQIRAAVTASFGSFIIGTTNAWSGGVLTQLNETFEMGPTENALIPSLLAFGALIGTLVVGKILDIIGRRKTFLFVSPIMAAGWVITGIATNIYLVFLGRFICGITSGFLFTAPVIYTSETCQAIIRGRLSSLLPMNLSLGVVTTYALGSYLNWRTSCFIMVIPNAIVFIAMYTLPESPYWHLLNGHDDLAYESMAYFRGSKYEIQEELDEMKLKIESVGSNISYKELLKPRTRLPLLIAIFVQIIQQLCGIQILMIYTIQIFDEAKTTMDSRLATVFTGVIQIIGNLVSIIFIDSCGRRMMFSISSFLVGFFVISLGADFYVLTQGIVWPSWVPIFSVFAGVFSYCIGLRPIPALIISEVFNTTVRSRASSLCCFLNRLTHIMVVQSYPYLKEAVGEAYIYFAYGTLIILCGLITLKVLPETKGKTLEEIQELFEKLAEGKKNKNQEITTL